MKEHSNDLYKGSGWPKETAIICLPSNSITIFPYSHYLNLYISIE